jgi:hypothetical protein
MKQRIKGEVRGTEDSSESEIYCGCTCGLRRKILSTLRCRERGKKGEEVEWSTGFRGEESGRPFGIEGRGGSGGVAGGVSYQREGRN